MRSRGNALRVGIERVLRVLVLVVLVFAALDAARSPAEEATHTADNASLPQSLGRWTVAPPSRIHLSLDVPPSTSEREWLRALRRAGTPVTWRGDAIRPLALETTPVADPRGGTMIWLIAPAGSRVAVHDAVAPIDTIVARDGGATVFAPVATGPLTIAAVAQRAVARERDSIVPRAVLVLGRATWEAKFVVAALEEAGWSVNARLALAPGVDVVQGPAGPPDTARHAAVVVLDAPSASAGSAIARYVRSGGGLVLAGASGRASSLSAVVAGSVGALTRPSVVGFADDAPRRALAFRALAPRRDAVVLEERDGRVMAAARRVETGRVAQVGYDETWRWRMGGGAQALDAHRAWWSALVSSVAHRAVVPLLRDSHDDEAPLARLVDALGKADASAGTTAKSATWTPSAAFLFVLVSALLLAELASRRLRGAP